MSTSQIEIERHDNGSQGEYIAKLAGSEDKAELSWSDRNGVRHATHTFVPPSHRGKGVAEELVKALVADAREQNFRIAPDCSYVERWFDRHKNYADLRA